MMRLLARGLAMPSCASIAPRRPRRRVIGRVARRGHRGLAPGCSGWRGLRRRGLQKAPGRAGSVSILSPNHNTPARASLPYTAVMHPSTHGPTGGGAVQRGRDACPRTPGERWKEG